MILTLPKNKKILLIAGVLLTLMVSVAVFSGGSDSQPLTDTNNEAALPERNNSGEIPEQTKYETEGDFFAEYRLQRERNRSREMSMLQELANNQEQSQSAREAASLKMMQLMEDVDKEMKAENLIKSRGIEECVVIIEPAMSTVVIKGAASAIDEDEIKRIICPVLQLSEDNVSLIYRE